MSHLCGITAWLCFEVLKNLCIIRLSSLAYAVFLLKNINYSIRFLIIGLAQPVSNNLRHNFKKSSNSGQKNLHFQDPVRANWSINRAVYREVFFFSPYLTISRVSAWFWEFTSCFRNMKNVLRCILSLKCYVTLHFDDFIVSSENCEFLT